MSSLSDLLNNDDEPSAPAAPAPQSQHHHRVPPLATLDHGMRLRGLEPLPTLSASFSANSVVAHSSSSSTAPLQPSALRRGALPIAVAAAAAPAAPDGGALKRTSRDDPFGLAANLDALNNTKLRRISISDSDTSDVSPSVSSSSTRTASRTSSNDDLPDDWPAPIAPTNSDFMIVAQPKPKQRKSYANENRYISPNPVVVVFTDSGGGGGGGAVSGTVACSLADAHGQIVTGDLALALHGATTVQLHGHGRAEFQLKMLATNGGEYVRLRFDINYATARDAGVPRQCVLVSDAFRIDTNVRRRASGRGRRKAESSEPATMRNVARANSFIHGSGSILSPVSATLIRPPTLSLSASARLTTSPPAPRPPPPPYEPARLLSDELDDDDDDADAVRALTELSFGGALTGTQ